MPSRPTDRPEGTMKRQCSECVWWKKDYGMWCFNGWTGMDRNDGHCHLEVKIVPKRGDDFCSHWESKDGEPTALRKT